MLCRVSPRECDPNKPISVAFTVHMPAEKARTRTSQSPPRSPTRGSSPSRAHLASSKSLTSMSVVSGASKTSEEVEEGEMLEWQPVVELSHTQKVPGYWHPDGLYCITPSMVEKFAEGYVHIDLWQGNQQLTADQIQFWMQSMSDLSRCKVSGDGLSFGKAGAHAHFTLCTRDTKGRLRSVGGDKFVLVMGGGGGGDGDYIYEAQDGNNGSYTITYSGNKTGEYAIAVFGVTADITDLSGVEQDSITDPEVLSQLEYEKRSKDVAATTQAEKLQALEDSLLAANEEAEQLMELFLRAAGETTKL